MQLPARNPQFNAFTHAGFMDTGPKRRAAVGRRRRPIQNTGRGIAPHSRLARIVLLWLVVGVMTGCTMLYLPDAGGEVLAQSGYQVHLELHVPGAAPQLFDGTAPSQVIAGGSFTLDVVGDLVESHRWRLDGSELTGSEPGVAIEGSNGSRLLLSDEEGNGPISAKNSGKVFTITLEISLDGFAYSGNHTLLVLPE